MPDPKRRCPGSTCASAATGPPRCRWRAAASCRRASRLRLWREMPGCDRSRWPSTQPCWRAGGRVRRAPHGRRSAPAASGAVACRACLPGRVSCRRGWPRAPGAPAPVRPRRLLSGGNDWLAYESYARDVLLSGPLMTEGRALGQGAPFYYQPLYIYWVALTHRRARREPVCAALHERCARDRGRARCCTC